ncbi:MAG: ATP-binding protein [Planctomycetaceae bacterium]
MGSRWSLRFVLASVALVALALTSLLLLESPRLRAQTLARTEAHFLDKVRALAHGLAGCDLDDPRLADWMNRLAEESGARVTVIAPDGTVKADSAAADVVAIGNHAGRAEIQAALRDGSATLRRRSDTLRINLLYAAARIPGTNGVARMAWETEFVDAEVARPVGRFWWVGGGLILLAACAAAVLGRTLTRSLGELAAAASAVEGGDLEAKVFPRGRDEIARLGHAFNRMTARMRESMARAEGEAARLAAVLESMQDGVLAIGEEERISFLNGSARTILGLPEDARVEGSRLYETIRVPALLGIVEAAVLQRAHVEREIEWEAASRRLVSVHAAPVPGGGPGLILVMRDMSRLRRLERMRTDFVSNVSHELRTPLAAITASAGNLEDEATRTHPEEGPRFVGAILRNAGRLQSLLDDILELSRYESRPEKAVFAPLDFAAVTRAAVEEFRERAAERGLTMRASLPDRATLVGDGRALRRIVDNLVLNALTYTPRGGRVSITLEAGEDAMRLAVSDTGIGIPAGDLERIFERFYRVDKARSRSAGGTGLGLSIVKHAAQLHGGGVEVESELGKGSTFTVRLPTQVPAAQGAARQEESA